MKKKYSLWAIHVLLFTLFLTGCQMTKQLIVNEYPTKVVKPDAPYASDNIEILSEHVNSDIERTGDVAARAVSFPIHLAKSFQKSLAGISDKNPYERTSPYYKEDFQQDMMADSMKGTTQPSFIRGQKYAPSFRVPFIFKEQLDSVDGFSRTSLDNVVNSGLAKDYLAFQRDLELDLDRADKYLSEGNYSEALELVDKVMNLDTSSHRGRALFEKIIRTRESSRIKREEKMREKIANDERIARYLGEAKEYLQKGRFSEALRVAKKALSVDPASEKARDFVDTIELSKFERSLRESGTSSFELLERMIHKHLSLYQQYTNESLADLASMELQKVSVLESYRDRLTAIEA